MTKKILVLDKGGMDPFLVKGLESEFDYGVEVIKEGSYVKKFLESNLVSLAIVDPYQAYGEIIENYVSFVKNDLKSRKIPVLIFSRTGIERLAGGVAFDLDLVLNKDYGAYLRKPAKLDKLVESVRELIEID